MSSARSRSRLAARRPEQSRPPSNRPSLFNTPEADAIVAALQVYPPDNAWNQHVDRWPEVHASSRNIISTPDPRREQAAALPNYDAMGLCPSATHGQKKVNVRITDYPQ